VKPGDFEHVDDLTHRLDDCDTFSIGLVRHVATGRVFVEVLHGPETGVERCVYVPVAVDPGEVPGWSEGAWEALSRMLGVEGGL
jgi:hypothetical protein